MGMGWRACAAAMAMVGAAEALVGGGGGGGRDRRELRHGTGEFDRRGPRRPTGKGTGDVWAEERKLAAAMEQVVVRKVGLRRWLEERRDFWPTEMASERRRVEMEEERKEEVLRREGWEANGRRAGGFKRLKRSRWEQEAMSEMRALDGDGGSGKGLVRYVDEDGQVQEVDTRTWPMITLEPSAGGLRIRGGGDERPDVKESKQVKRDKEDNFRWRSMLDNILVVEMKKNDGASHKFSISGNLLDCFLASQVLVAVQILVDFFIAIPVLKFYAQVCSVGTSFVEFPLRRSASSSYNFCFRA
eukprot:465143-Hanusia_phi.AAC.1